MAIDPNVINHSTVTNPGGLATGVVVNPFLPVEINRESDASLYDVVKDPNSLPDFGSGSSGGPSGGLTSLAVVGDDDVAENDTVTYTASIAGTDVDTSQGTFLWTVADVAATIADADKASTEITFTATGTAKVQCVYTEDGVTGSPVTGTLDVTVS